MQCPQEIAESQAQLSYYWRLVDEEEGARDLQQRAEAIFQELGLDRRLAGLQERMQDI